MSERLYYSDSRLTQFTARVVDIVEINGRSGVVLDRTAFYPTGGGQPHDRGTINGIAVVDVLEDESGRVIHITESEPDGPGATVEGRVDWTRRLDHIQQHTGQHILSQAFIRVCNAETRGFRIDEESATIDIMLDSPTQEIISEAEELANRIVFEDRPVNIHQATSEEELSRFPLRKDPAVEGCIRIIEVSGFDFSPCGGTHARRTGEIGLIAVRGWERAKRMCRIEFVCGGRALRDYRKANRAATEVALLFSTARDAGPESVARLIDENKQQKRRIKELLQLATEAEAMQLLERAEQRAGFQLVKSIFDRRDIEEVKLLAQKITARGLSVVLFGVRDRDAARLVFARSSGLEQDMGVLIARACAELGGRGGGRPELAQGGGPNAAKLQEVIDQIEKEL